MTEQTLTLQVGAQRYNKWKAVEINRGIEQLAGAFSLTCADAWALSGQPLPDLRGQRCTVRLNEAPIITGFIEAVEPAYDKQSHDLTIRGRDATGDLVDCAAISDGQGWQSTSLLRMARDLCRPFGVSVSSSLPADTPFRAGRISPGETVAEVLGRAAAVAGCLLVSDGLGGLRITRAGSARANTRLKRGINILSGQGSDDDSNRFARYQVIGQSAGKDADQQILASATDKGVRASRVTVLQVADDVDADKAQQYARWAAATGLARSRRASVVVAGWLDGDRAWWPNTLVTIHDDYLRLDGDYLIAGVSHRIDRRAGKVTVLELTPPGAYTPAPVIDLDEESA